MLGQNPDFLNFWAQKKTRILSPKEVHWVLCTGYQGLSLITEAFTKKCIFREVFPNRLTPTLPAVQLTHFCYMFQTQPPEQTINFKSINDQFSPGSFLQSWNIIYLIMHFIFWFEGFPQYVFQYISGYFVKLFPLPINI